MTATTLATRVTPAGARTATGPEEALSGCSMTGASRSAPTRSTCTGGTTARVSTCPRPAGCCYWDGNAFVPVGNAVRPRRGGQPVQHDDLRRRATPPSSGWRSTPTTRSRPAFSNGRSTTPASRPTSRRGHGRYRPRRRAGRQDLPERDVKMLAGKGGRQRGDLEQRLRSRHRHLRECQVRHGHDSGTFSAVGDYVLQADGGQGPP